MLVSYWVVFVYFVTNVTYFFNLFIGGGGSLAKASGSGIGGSSSSFAKASGSGVAGGSSSLSGSSDFRK